MRRWEMAFLHFSLLTMFVVVGGVMRANIVFHLVMALLFGVIFSLQYSSTLTNEMTEELE